MVGIIAAIGKNRELGKSNDLLWRIPDDLKRFKQLTTGHPIVMGRKTFESIGRPLPGRINIVITRDTSWTHEGVVVKNSLHEALEAAKEIDQEVFVIGGAQIYEQALPFIDKLYLTLIDAKKDADIFFPPYEHLFTHKIFEETHDHNGLKYTWINLEKEKTTQ